MGIAIGDTIGCTWLVGRRGVGWETESRGIFLLSHEVPNSKVLRGSGAPYGLNFTRMRVHAISVRYDLRFS